MQQLEKTRVKQKRVSLITATNIISVIFCCVTAKRCPVIQKSGAAALPEQRNTNKAIKMHSCYKYHFSCLAVLRVKYIFHIEGPVPNSLCRPRPLSSAVILQLLTCRLCTSSCFAASCRSRLRTVCSSCSRTPATHAASSSFLSLSTST